jgi:hypothetical protein
MTSRLQADLLATETQCNHFTLISLCFNSIIMSCDDRDGDICGPPKLALPKNDEANSSDDDEEGLSADTIRQALAEAEDAGHKRMREIERNKERVGKIFAGQSFELNIGTVWISILKLSLTDLREGRWVKGDIIDAFNLVLSHERPLVWAVPYSIFCPDNDSICRKSRDDLVRFFSRGGMFFTQRRRLILIPLNSNGSHWTLFIADREHGIIYHLDSVRSIQVSPRIQRLAEELVDLFSHVSFSTGLAGKKPTQWSLKLNQRCPLQTNNVDCGVFVCFFMHELAHSRLLDSSDDPLDNFLNELKFTNSTNFRNRISQAFDGYMSI